MNDYGINHCVTVYIRFCVCEFHSSSLYLILTLVELSGEISLLTELPPSVSMYMNSNISLALDGSRFFFFCSLKTDDNR